MYKGELRHQISKYLSSFFSSGVLVFRVLRDVVAGIHVFQTKYRILKFSSCLQTLQWLPVSLRLLGCRQLGSLFDALFHTY